MRFSWWKLAKAAQFVYYGAERPKYPTRMAIQWVRLTGEYFEATDGTAIIRVLHSEGEGSDQLQEELYFKPVPKQALPKSAEEVMVWVEKDGRVNGAVYAKNARELGPLDKYFYALTQKHWEAEGNRWPKIERVFTAVEESSGPATCVYISATNLARFQAFDDADLVAGVKLTMGEHHLDPIKVVPHGSDHDEWYGLIMPMRE